MMLPRPRRRWLWFCVGFALSAWSPAGAQSQLASLAGTATDTSAGTIPNLLVQLTDMETGEARSANMNSIGTYLFPAVKPGKYEFEAETAGCRRYRHADLVLETGVQARLDFQMQVGAVQNSVTMVGPVPLLGTESSAVGNVVENRTIASMPLINRRALQLIKLSGFVVPVSNEQGRATIAGGSGGENMDRVYGRLLVSTSRNDRGPVFSIPGVDSFNQIVVTTYQNLSGTWFHNFSPGLLNEFRASWMRRTTPQWHGGYKSGMVGKFGLKGTDLDLFPQAGVEGLTGLGNDNSRQYRSQSPIRGNDFSDHVSKIRGAHTFKFGFEYREDFNVDDFRGTGGGTLSFTSTATNDALAALLLGWVNSGGRQENLLINSRADYLAAFVQDDWRAAPNFTLPLGLRWDYDQPQWEQFANRQNSFDRFAINPVSGTPGAVTFSERNGLTPTFLLQNGMPPLSAPGESRLTPAFGAVPVGQSPTTSVLFLDTDRRNGYLEQFNFNVQRQISRNLPMEVGYINRASYNSACTTVSEEQETPDA